MASCFWFKEQHYHLIAIVVITIFTIIIIIVIIIAIIISIVRPHQILRPTLRAEVTARSAIDDASSVMADVEAGRIAEAGLIASLSGGHRNHRKRFNRLSCVLGRCY